MTDHHSHLNWIWISGSVFGLMAGIIKYAFFPEPGFNPPDMFALVVTFLIAALLWWLVIAKNGEMSTLRGAIAGALIGFVTPPLMWLMYGLYLFFTAPKPVEALLWSPAYALIMLTRVSWITVIPGALVGAIIAFTELTWPQIRVRGKKSNFQARG